jgi:predicted membrane-bound mannosyltransferase
MAQMAFAENHDMIEAFTARGYGKSTEREMFASGHRNFVIYKILGCVAKQ